MVVLSFCKAKMWSCTSSQSRKQRKWRKLNAIRLQRNIVQEAITAFAHEQHNGKIWYLLYFGSCRNVQCSSQ
ncbi:hypothetical protein M514_28558 [Trichuris suis]|uniref:Uncharacterized protein n=1 Tax=Trichuris suis TaxID=68888 RepID=A0A085MPW8_9BILA|nr:hypothetical protein M514_28558 [Trichuris suis]